MNEETLYQRIGGEATINAATDRFFERVLADSKLNHFFVAIPMPRLKTYQAAFLSQTLGGPKQYSGASMQMVHSRLAIEQHHFDRVATHLVETLHELGIAEETIGEVASAVIPLANQIVNTNPATHPHS